MDLVVLSACQTQLGELSAGDELVGLTRAFFFAGTPTVIASLWNVNDKATALLMERFYTHLREGMDKAGALREAQLEVMETHPDPYYWAGFVLSGDGGEVGAVSPRLPGSSETERVDEGEAQENPVTPVKVAPSRPYSWVWLVVGGGMLAAIILGVMIWRQRRAT